MMKGSIVYKCQIYNKDCVSGSVEIIKDKEIDLIICDPPFGINETGFYGHYSRKQENVIDGYQEAPSNYYKFTFDWMSEAKRILKDDGSMYIFIGHTNLINVLNVAQELKLFEVNHLIWKYNFGVYTKRKFVTSHYHILYYAKNKNSKRTFNLNCRFGSQEKDDNNRSLLYKDLEDVFVINKEYERNVKKNQNKLPEKLIEKLILYSSYENDNICDFFLGSFVTAISAKKLGRNIYGFEKNKKAYDAGMAKMSKIDKGERLKDIGKVKNIIPVNQGKPITQEERKDMLLRYKRLKSENKYSKKEIVEKMGLEFGRGKFGIINIIKSFNID